MLNFTTDQWIILALVFVLGLLVGMWMTSGGRRKWKTRYNEELEQRRTLEKTHKEREAHWAEREKEWREQDSVRTAALRDRDTARGDYDRDGIPDRRETPLNRGDYDRDGVPDNRDRRPDDDRRY
ncbi:hypothetical protein ACFQPG_05865 [Sphingomonas sp. GCM10030256]|uniref:hypothetical protein n=1 Tax=Sphingomonas sp. GCM10030256 TaxID=3273427 RepID=UPI0036097DD1